MASFDLKRFQQRENTDRVLTNEEMEALRTEAAMLNETLERDYVVRQDQWASQAEELNAFYHNAQFTEEQERTLALHGQSAIPINVIFPAVEQAVSLLTNNKPRFQATAREDSDTKTAKVVSDLMTYIWDNSDGSRHLKTALYDYYVRGRGCLQVSVDPYADYGRGEIFLESIHPLDVFPDPASRDRLWRDAAHVLISRLYTREQIEAMWPDAEEMGIMSMASSSASERAYASQMAMNQDQELGPLGGSRDAEEFKVIWRYSKVKQTNLHIFDTTNREEKALTEEEFRLYIEQPAIHVFQEGVRESFATEGGELRDLLELYDQAEPSPVAPNARTIMPPPQMDPQTGQMIQPPPIVLTLLTIGNLIEDGLIEVRPVLLDRIQLVISIGGYEYYNNILPISDYPIVPFNNKHDRNPYPMSDVAFARPMQQALNKLNMQIIANLATTNNNKVIVPRGSVDRRDVEEQLAKTGPGVIEVNYEMGEPKPFGAGQIPNGLFMHMQNMVQMIEREFGLYSTMQGDPEQAPETYHGTLAIDEFGQRRIKSKLDDIESALNQVGRVVMQFMPKVYTEEKTIRLVQPNNTVRETVANQLQYDDLGGVVGRINDITTGAFDTLVVSGSTLPSNRWALQNYVLDLYRERIVDQVEVLKKSEVVDMEGVLERSGYIAQLERKIQEMEGEIKKLGNELTSARTNEITAKKQVIVEKAKRAIGSTEDKAEAAVALFVSRLEDQLKLQDEQAKLEQQKESVSSE